MALNRPRFADRPSTDGSAFIRSAPPRDHGRGWPWRSAWAWACTLGALLLGSGVGWAAQDEVPVPAPEAIWSEVAEHCAREVEAVAVDSSRPALCTRLAARGRQLECVSGEMVQRSDPERHAGLGRWAICLRQVAQPLTDGWYMRPAEIDRRVDVCNGEYVSAATLAKPASWLTRAMRKMEFKYWLEPMPVAAPVPVEAPVASRVRTPISGAVQCNTLLAQSNVPQYINMPNTPLASVKVELPESRPGAPAPIVLLLEPSAGKGGGKGKRAVAPAAEKPAAAPQAAKEPMAGKDSVKTGADAVAEKVDLNHKAGGQKVPVRVQPDAGR